MNPLVPGAGDIALALAIIVNTILVIVALVALARAPKHQRRLSTVLLTLLVPFAGSIVSLVAGRAPRHEAATSAVE